MRVQCQQLWCIYIARTAYTYMCIIYMQYKLYVLHLSQIGKRFTKDGKTMHLRPKSELYYCTLFF